MSRNIIAILRGIEPKQTEKIGAVLIDAGIDRIEVPLNSPDPMRSIGLLAEAFGEQAIIGAGTVLSSAEVDAVAEVGGRMIVSPDCNPEVISATRASGLLSFPGVVTPSEAFIALRHGADGLKLFPSFLVGMQGLQAMRAVLPPGTETWAVGGVGPVNFDQWIAAGVTGFGIGSELYRAGFGVDEVARRASAIVNAYDVAITP